MWSNVGGVNVQCVAVFCCSCGQHHGQLCTKWNSDTFCQTLMMASVCTLINTSFVAHTAGIVISRIYRYLDSLLVESLDFNDCRGFPVLPSFNLQSNQRNGKIHTHTFISVKLKLDWGFTY